MKRVAKTDPCVLKLILNQVEYLISSYGYNLEILQIFVELSMWQPDYVAKYTCRIFYKEGIATLSEKTGMEVECFINRMHESFTKHNDLIKYVEKQIANISEKDKMVYDMVVKLDQHAPAT